jgi:hypothetical protein
MALLSVVYHAGQCSDHYDDVICDHSWTRWCDRSLGKVIAVIALALWTVQIRRRPMMAAMSAAWFALAMSMYRACRDYPYFLCHSLWHISIGMCGLWLHL